MWRGKDVLSITEFSKQDLRVLFDEAERYLRIIEEGEITEDLKGRILATAFFEPSTRTKLSFQSAMLRLGGKVIDLPPAMASSIAKGENLADTIRMLDAYADIIVIRHKVEGAARFAAKISNSPIINGGDGTRDHPTQAMIDLFTIKRELRKIENLSVGVLGDLKYGRAARSFILGIAKYNPQLYLISPEILKVREDVIDLLEEMNIKYEEVTDLKEVLSELDVLYVTRIQRERFPDPMEYERVKGSYKIDEKTLSGAKDNLIILHPLPRVDELDFSIDKTSHARYFQQAAYGVPVRMAILKLVLSGE